MSTLVRRSSNCVLILAAFGCLTVKSIPTSMAAPQANGGESPSSAAPIKWVEDFDGAKKTAVAQGKDLLIDFTGSDWCGWCVRLRQEVFDQAAFQTATKQFVFVELDYPNKKPQPVAIKQQNARLKDQFAIEGYPSIFLADAKGKPYAKTGYQAGGPEKYLQLLADLRKVRDARDAAWAEAGKSAGVDRARALAKGLDALDAELVAQHYKSVVDEVAKLDPNDESGAAGKYGLMIDLAAANAKLSGREGVSAAQARAAIDAVLKGRPQADNGQRQQALFGVVNYCQSPRDNAFVVALMDEVAKLDPATDVGKQAAAIKARIDAKMKPAAVIPAEGALDASNFAAVAAAKGKSIVVEGVVASAIPTKTGGNLSITLVNNDKGLIVFVRQRELATLNDSNDGDFAKALRGQRIRVRGVVDDYGGHDPRLKGRPQISLGGADQIQVLAP